MIKPWDEKTSFISLLMADAMKPSSFASHFEARCLILFKN